LFSGVNRRQRPLRILTSLVLATLMLSTRCLLPARAQASQSSRPKLVLLLVADQFSYDYLNRYQDRLGAGGLRFLMEHGANFLSCKFEQGTTHTATGHAIIATGANPWATGIVANDWFDRRKNKEVVACAEDTFQMVGANGPGAGTRAMTGTTIGDQMKLATNGRSKVITVALKDRASVFLAGRLANAAYWWDTRSGNFVTSSQYGSVLANWARAFNDQHYADRYFGKPWQRFLPENQYTASTRDDYSWERPIPGDGRQFPHVITGGINSPGEGFYDVFAMTPWANQMVADFAREAIEREGLGQRSDPDFLGISFSAGDYLGHAFGPYSQEVEDLVLRLDQTLSSFFQYVDQKVGLDQCLIVLTSDHAVMPIPEFLKEKGLDAGRIDPKAFRNLLDSALDSRLGPDDWIQAFDPPNLYLNLDAIDKQKYRQPDVEALAAKLARSIPGVGDVYTAFQFFMQQLPTGPLLEAAKKNYFWGRSGELVVFPKPNHIFISELNGTTHGSPYGYDTQVPLIFYGTAITGGQYGRSCSPVDIAPTLAAILGIAAPSISEGRVLDEAIGQVYGPPRTRMFAAPGETQSPGKGRH